MMRRFLLTAMAGMCLLGASPAIAHRGHHTLSVVEIDNKGAVRVTHNLSAHDTEPELVGIAPDAQPSLDNPDALKALQAHLAATFTVNGIRLELVSTELAGDDAIFVFEGKLPRRPDRVSISYGLFPQSVQTGVGLVNVRLNGVTKSLTFGHGGAPQMVDFGKGHQAP